MKQQQPSSVKSAARALDVVEHVARRGAQNARAISRASGIPESSLSYLLATLVERGWLVQGADRAYAIGPALRRLAAGAPPPFLEHARRLVRALTAATDETSSLFALREDEIESIEVALSSQFLRFAPHKGLRVPLHGFAAGKAILAALPPAALEDYMARSVRARFTANTLVEEAALRRDLVRTRERGYALAIEEHTLGVNGIAMALGDGLSISVAIPTPRFDAAAERRIAEVLGRLVGELG
jgi:IclR family acetate operon transcriptional repressor